jgi:SagB-type dehydrogenase family enzyme
MEDRRAARVTGRLTEGRAIERCLERVAWGRVLYERGVRVNDMTEIRLPEPKFRSASSFEASLRERRSVREFSSASLSLASVGQLLWAAQGLTAATGERTAPSAGALYPLELYLVAGSMERVAPGVYRYEPPSHALRSHCVRDRRPQLAEAALGQTAITGAAAVLVATAVYGRTSVKYGSRGNRYVHMEVGHVAQNVYLQAQSLGLGTVIIGAFDDERVREVLELQADENPLALMPIGARR